MCPANAAPPVLAVASNEIVGPVWLWQRTQLADGKLVTPAAPERYTLAFQGGGRVNLRADCNRGSGAYEVNGNAMKLGAAALTRMGCPAGLAGQRIPGRARPRRELRHRRQRARIDARRRRHDALSRTIPINSITHRRNAGSNVYFGAGGNNPRARNCAISRSAKFGASFATVVGLIVSEVAAQMRRLVLTS